MIRRLVFLSVLLLSGCELLPLTEAPVSVADPELAWTKHQLQLAKLEAWALDGRISLRKGEEVWHVNLHWQQIASAYHINLYGPFGAGAAKLDGSPQSAILQHDGQTTQSDNAEQLLRQRLGMQVPVNGLRYWAIGLPAAGSAYTQELDPAGRLAVLRQDGWRVRYRAYRAVNGLVLPSKIFLDHDDLDVRLVVDQWRVVGLNSENKGE